MKYLKRSVFFLIILFKKLRFLFYELKLLLRNRPPTVQFIHHGVPYYSQFTREAEDDLDYLNWSWNRCGMACFQMIYSHLSGRKIPLIRLCKRSLKYSVYSINTAAFFKGDHLNSLPGLFYKPFLNFIKKEFNLEGKILSPMISEEITKELSHGNFIMASVGHSKSGHLILVLGYDLKKKVFYVHNPSAHDEDDQRYQEISFKKWRSYFRYKGIVIYQSVNQTSKRAT